MAQRIHRAAYAGASIRQGKVLLLAPFITSVFPVIAALILSMSVPALATEQKEDVYLEGGQSHFKVEKGKRYHGKWTGGALSANPTPQKQPAPVPAPEPASVPPAAVEDEVPEGDEAESAAYNRLKKAIKKGGSGSPGVLNAGGIQAGVAPGGGLKAGQEISDQAGVLSCKFTGLAEEEGKTVVRLMLKNTSGKAISAIFGSFRILDSAGKVVRSTGVTYNAKPIGRAEEKKMTLFRYLAMKEKEEKLLKGDPGKVSLLFSLDSVEYEDGTKAEF